MRPEKKLRAWEWLTLMVVVNDERGNPMGLVERIDIEAPGHCQAMLSLVAPIPGPVFRDISKIDSWHTKRFIKVSRRLFRVYAYRSWVGNSCCAYAIGPKTAAKLVNYVRSLRYWHAEEGYSKLFAKFEKGQEFKRTDFFVARVPDGAIDLG